MTAVAGCHTTLAQEQPPTLNTQRLNGADNFRDLAGTHTAYNADHGAHLRPNLIFRSNALSEASDSDLVILKNLGITTMIDLRTDKEVAEHPDRLPEGTHLLHIDILGNDSDLANLASKLTSPSEATSLMKQLYHDFVTDPSQRRAFAQVLTTIAQTDSPVLIHCTNGKDRTGWATALLQLNAGVSEETVMADYLATNDYSKSSISRTVSRLEEQKGAEAAQTYRTLLGVQGEFLQAALESMHNSYTDLGQFLSDGLGLAPTTIHTLKSKLTSGRLSPGGN